MGDLFTRPYEGSVSGETRKAHHDRYVANAAIAPGDYVMLVAGTSGLKVAKAVAGSEAIVVGVYEGKGGSGAADAAYLAAALAAGLRPFEKQPKAAAAGDSIAIITKGFTVASVLGSGSLAAGDALKVSATAGAVERDATVQLLRSAADEAYTTTSIALKKVLVNFS